MEKIVIGSDHAAFKAKEFLKGHLKDRFEIIDVGTDSEDSCHYPVFAKKACEEVIKNGVRGILLCGSGIGVSMVANRFSGIRAALCRAVIDAQLSRQHNNANVLCLGARLTKEDDMLGIVDVFLGTSFEGGRHVDRVAMFENLGEKLV